MIHPPGHCRATETCGNSSEKPLGFLTYVLLCNSCDTQRQLYLLQLDEVLSQKPGGTAKKQHLVNQTFTYLMYV